MLDFSSDYARGCHQEILSALAKTNDQSFPGYGADELCARATQLIRDACACPEASVIFLEGGTQTNQIASKMLLRPWQGIVAAETAHVATHEAGAIEHAGHKVLTLPAHDGKISAAAVTTCLEAHAADENREHMVEPGMVYITHPTEYGTLYTLEDLEALARACKRGGIPLYLDGARLGYALAAQDADVTLADIARLTDCFYIGGTKLGALFGEALVMPRMAYPRSLSLVKQSGALMAKGWLLGLQFATLFDGAKPGSAEGSLYLRGAQNAIRCAGILREGLLAKGYELAVGSPTNQQFAIVGDDELERLGTFVRYGFWEKVEAGRTVIRFATSWYTTEDEVHELLGML